jgi:hypothetical protein
LGIAVDLAELVGSPHDQLKLSFDYTTAEATEKLYVHLWGYVNVSSGPTTSMMNLGATSGNAWESSGSAMTAYNLGKPNGAFTGTTAGGGSDAAVLLTGSTGAQHYRGIFDLSAFTTAPNSVAGYDYLVLGFTRNTGGTAPAVTISNVVLQEVPTLASWLSGFGLSGTNALSTANPDGDALNNLYEFGLGGNPTNSADVGHLPLFGASAEGGTNFMEYTYARRIGSASELNYYLELATDLVAGNWTNSGYVELPTLGNIDDDFEAVTNRVDTSGKTNEFIRLRIEEL